MKLLSAEQIRDWDNYTIQNKPISSYNLMESAASLFTDWFSSIYKTEKTVCVFCGTGNNGGDGLAIARMLHHRFFNVHVYICHLSKNETPDFQKNLELLPQRAQILRGSLRENDAFPQLPEDAIVVDALLGGGLSRPVDGYWADFFTYLNNSDLEIVSVDIPSGLFADRNTDLEKGSVIQAHRVLSFEIPKLAFLMPENQRFIQHFEFKSIGLEPSFLDSVETKNVFITREIVAKILKKRNKFDHKGVFGRALLVVGSFGMAGAAVLAARACMRSGVGILTVQTPKSNRIILQTTVPEAIVRLDADEFVISQNVDTESVTAIGIGCGMGKAGRTAAALKQYLATSKRPMVIDADALNLIADNPEMLNLIPEGSILTPHLKEFERLFGKSKNDFDRLEVLRISSKSLKINILLKGAHTIVANTEGVCFFNSTGNAGMATAGSGDVLTGLLTGLLAQGYAPENAAVLGVYLHGLAGDLAAKRVGQQALIASDIVDNLGAAFLNFQRNNE